MKKTLLWLLLASVTCLGAGEYKQPAPSIFYSTVKLPLLNTSGIVTNTSGGQLGTINPVPIANGGTNSTAALSNNKVIVSSGGTLGESSTTTTQLGFLDATSSIQTQLNSKQGTLSVGALDGQTVNSSGAAISGSSIYMQSADLTHPGVVNNTTQTFGGAKTFGSGGVTINTGTMQTATSTDFTITSGINAKMTVQSQGAAGEFQLGNPTAAQNNGLTLTQIGTPANNPASGYDKLYFKSDDSLYSLKTDGTETKIGTGSGGGINYFSANPDAEANTNGYATYNDGASNIPVDCTGGTATSLTFSRSTSTPLRGIGSFSMAQANSTSLQGKGVSYDFTIDSADKGQVETASFDYNASSTFVASNGTTAPLNDATTSTNAGNSDVEFFIYDVTNASFIPVTPQVMTSNGANNSKFFGTWQAASNSTSYRACWHVATTSANATGWTYKFDNVIVGPQAITHGPAISDYKNDKTFTVNNMGTIANSNFWYKKEGDHLRVKVYFTQGTASASIASITLPFTIDSSKLAASKTSYLGSLNNLNSGAPFASPQGIALFYDGSDTAKIYLAIVEGSNAYSKALGNTWSTGDSFSGEFSVPIAGWSSNVDMSNDADTRTVAAKYNTSSTSIPNNGGTWTILNFSNKVYDDYSAVTTGASWVYTAPVSGKYSVKVAVQGACSGSSAGSATGLYLYKNGSLDSYLGNMFYWSVVSGGMFGSGSGEVLLTAGDTISVEGQNACGASNVLDGVATHNTITIERLSGPATIAAPETTSMRAYNSATSISGSLATISWTTVDWDDHGAYSAGTWTCPVPGKYQVNAELTVSGTIALNNTIDLQLQKNGTAISEDVEYAGGAMTQQQASINDMFRCVSGDTIRVQASSSATLPTIVNSNTKSYLSLIRVGNY